MRYRSAYHTTRSTSTSTLYLKKIPGTCFHSWMSVSARPKCGKFDLVGEAASVLQPYPKCNQLTPQAAMLMIIASK